MGTTRFNPYEKDLKDLQPSNLCDHDGRNPRAETCAMCRRVLSSRHYSWRPNRYELLGEYGLWGSLAFVGPSVLNRGSGGHLSSIRGGVLLVLKDHSRKDR